MKNIIYFITFIFLSINIFAQNPITPNGKEVIAVSYPYLNQAEIDYINDQISTNFPGVITIQSPQPYFGTFNCHFFAWHNNQGFTIWSGSGNIWQNGMPSEYKWLDYPTDYFSDENFSNPYGYTSYVQTTESSAPIAVYKLSGTIRHSARRLSGSTDLISKWGAWGIYQHGPTEVLAIYGSIAENYKINPNYRPVGSGDPGRRNWGTINNALSGIPSNSAVTVFTGTHYLSTDVQINSGITLKINTNATVNLVNGSNRYSIIPSGGTIINNGTISGLRAKLQDYSSSTFKGYYGTIQAAINAADDIDQIDLEDGPFTESISISGKNNLFINNGTLNGSITATNSDGLYISQTEFTNMYLNNCEMPYLNNVHMLGSGSGTGVYVFNIGNSNIPKSSIVSYNFSTGLYAISSYFGLEADSWLYDLTDGISSNYSSNISLYQVQLCGVSGYHLAAYTNGYISAASCYYDNGTANIHESGGTVVCYTVNACSLAKRGNNSGSTESEIISYYSDDEFGKINNQLDNLSKQVSSEFKAGSFFDKGKYKNDFLNINNQIKDYIKGNPESNYRSAALTTAVHCYKAVEDYESMRDFLEELKDDAEIGRYAERYMIDYYRSKKDFENAIKTADELLGKGDGELDNIVLYSKGLILAHDMNKPEQASVCFSTIIENDADKGLTALAENQLSVLGYEVDKSVTKSGEIENNGIELDNYPNPFNPTTTISYTLPEAGAVQVKIYDILGREVAKLVDEQKSAGKYTVNWNGSNYASGVYFSSITFNNQRLYKKMLMIK